MDSGFVAPGGAYPKLGGLEFLISQFVEWKSRKRDCSVS